jgi:hypothetical protein
MAVAELNHALPYEPDDTDILVRGWLKEARTTGGRETLTKRWVVMQKRTISVYQDVVTSEERRLGRYLLQQISDLSFESESREHWFSFQILGDKLKFYAASKAERDTWLAPLRTWVPLMRMEATRALVAKKAESQTAKELAVLQEQMAVHQICSAESKIIVLASVRDYIGRLIRDLREVLHALEIVVTERMSMAHYFSTAIDNLVDSTNSTIAALSDFALKQEIGHRTKAIIGAASSLIQEGRSAGHDQLSASRFRYELSWLRDSLLSFIAYLQYLGLCSVLENDLQTFQRGVLNLMVQTSAAPPKPPRVPPSHPSPAARLSAVSRSASVAEIAGTPPAVAPRTSRPPVVPRRSDRRSVPHSFDKLVATQRSSQAAAMEETSPALSEFNSRVSNYAVQVLKDMEQAVEETKMTISQQSIDKVQRREIFHRTQNLLQTGSRVIGRMQSVCGSAQSSAPDDSLVEALSDFEQQSSLLSQGIAAVESAIAATEDRSAAPPPPPRPRRASKVPSTYLSQTIYDQLNGTRSTAQNLLRFVPSGAAAVASFCTPHVHYLGEVSTRLVDLLATSLKSSESLCSPAQEEMIMASLKGVELSYSKLLAQITTPKPAWLIEAIAALWCIKSIIPHLVTAVRPKFEQDHPDWSELTQLAAEIGLLLTELEQLLRTEHAKFAPRSQLTAAALYPAISQARQALISFRPTRIPGINELLDNSYASSHSLISRELELISLSFAPGPVAWGESSGALSSDSRR